MECGSEPLLRRRLGKQIAGELLDRELVERLIAIDCGDDPSR
jgi:hypothetical protein